MTRRDPKAVLSTQPPPTGLQGRPKLSHKALMDAGILHRRPQHEKAAGHLSLLPGFPTGANCD